jgi:hypothetical protein
MLAETVPSIDPSWVALLQAVAVHVAILDVDGDEIWSNRAPFDAVGSRQIDRRLDTATGRTLVVRTAVAHAGEPEPSAQPPTGIDTDRLDAMVTELGSSELTAQVVGAFLSQLDERIDALESDDAWARRCAADALGSAAQLVGALELSEICAAVAQGNDAVPIRPAARRAADDLRRWRDARGLATG